MKKIAVIGLGGIGSNFIKYFLETIDTFEKKEMIFLKLFDKDIVEEKNIRRSNQHFRVEDIMMQKAESLAKRYEEYGLDFENIFIDESNVSKLEKYEHLVMCVDNHKVRKLLYKYALDNEKWLIDLRSQGTLMAYTIVDGTYDMEYYNNSIFKNAETMEKKGSCQLEADIVNDNFQNANKTIAFYVANCIYLQKLRDNDIACKEFKTTF